jgi:hypothetical protein
MNIHDYIEEIGIKMEKPTGFSRSDLFWKLDNEEPIQPDLIGEKEVKPGQNVAVGIFSDFKCFKMIVSLSNGVTYVYKEGFDINLLEADNIHVLPR